MKRRKNYRTRSLKVHHDQNLSFNRFKHINKLRFSFFKKIIPFILFLFVSSTVCSLIYVGWFFLFKSELFQIIPPEPPVLLHFSKEEFQKQISISMKNNLLDFDISTVTYKLSMNLWLNKVKISKQLPHSVVIELKEFFPQIAVELGDFYLADENGFLFKRAEIKELDAIPILKGINRYDYQNNPAKYQEWIRKAILIKNLYHAEGVSRPILHSIQMEISRVNGALDFILIAGEGNEIWVNGIQMNNLQKLFSCFDVVWSEYQKLKKFPVKLVLDCQNYPKFVSGKQIESLDVD